MRLYILLAVSALTLSAQINRDDPAHPIRVKAIEFVAVGEQEEEDLRKLLPIREGDTVLDSDFVRTAKTIVAFDRGLVFAVGMDPADGPRDARVRISGAGRGPAAYHQPARLKSRVEPDYPARARSEHVQGTVRLNILVGADGTVRDTYVSSGPALLTEAAIAAVKQWVYDPPLSNGEPSEGRVSADVAFHLMDGTPEPPPPPRQR